MKRYSIIRNYWCADFYEVRAASEAEALKLVKRGEGFIKTKHADVDESVDVTVLQEEAAS